MARLTAGRRLDAGGRPIDGTGFVYESESRLAELLAQRCSPLFSQPITGEWVVGLETSEMSGGAYERGLGLFPPGNAGPPEHIHPTYDEHFEIVQGRFVFRVKGQEQEQAAGDALLVPTGTPHTFRCVGEELGAVLVTTRPAARTGFVIQTLFGMAHEGKLTQAGQPTLLHAAVVGAEYADDTVFTSPPPSVALFMARLMAPLGRALGYRATDPKYLDPAFWAARVEQPPTV